MKAKKRNALLAESDSEGSYSGSSQGKGSEQFSVEVTHSTPARREQFTLIMPLRGGADDRIIRVSLWE